VADELANTATSPTKLGDIYMSDVDSNAKKILAFDNVQGKDGELLAITN
jgi:hypothetical protein